ncbi:hypothetical protein IHE44_0003141 [Lamprotornis superbus]|uniref:LRRCT domain-containing protein n=1 Tax=Lamprotornis superbus TaxID=245042 RepID=A0A835NV00_9PASS|nr:hypothetical protein IHE44_0003141 [Lamprotornis superbus]
MRLHLNNNELKILRADTFLGIENLEYLQADYNLIKFIERGAFNKLHKLKVLILNDNLISFLPDNIFRFASLTHLDIRGNRIQKLPYIGVLEHIGRIVELQLEDNPWNCTCDLLPLKAWLENMPYNIYIGEAICETPSDLYGRLLKETNKQELCSMGTGSDFDVRILPPSQLEPGYSTPNGHTTQTSVHRLVTKPPKTTNPSKISGIVAGKALSNRNLSQIVSYQTRVPPLTPCPVPCVCKTHPSDLGLSVNCQERNIESMAELVPKPLNAKKLHVNGNYIKDVDTTDFAEFEGLDLLHLGSNRISVIKGDVFRNLTNLRRLYLNGNQIERLSPEMFAGLHNLQYLYLEYNVIKEILAGTFDLMPNLQLLYLNNNLLRSLPAYIFAGAPLARLNLRNNHFMYLPLRKHDHKSNKKDGLGAEAFIPQTIEQMSKNHTCGLKESETGFTFADPPGQKVILRNVNDKEKDLLHVDTRKRLSTIDELDELFPGRDSNDFIDPVSPSQQGILLVYALQIRLQVTSLVTTSSYSKNSVWVMETDTGKPRSPEAHGEGSSGYLPEFHWMCIGECPLAKKLRMFLALFHCGDGKALVDSGSDPRFLLLQQPSQAQRLENNDDFSFAVTPTNLKPMMVILKQYKALYYCGYRIVDFCGVCMFGNVENSRQSLAGSPEVVKKYLLQYSRLHPRETRIMQCRKGCEKSCQRQFGHLEQLLIMYKQVQDAYSSTLGLLSFSPVDFDNIKIQTKVTI